MRRSGRRHDQYRRAGRHGLGTPPDRAGAVGQRQLRRHDASHVCRQRGDSRGCDHREDAPRTRRLRAGLHRCTEVESSAQPAGAGSVFTVVTPARIATLSAHVGRIVASELSLTDCTSTIWWRTQTVSPRAAVLIVSAPGAAHVVSQSKVAIPYWKTKPVSSVVGRQATPNARAAAPSNTAAYRLAV